MDKMPPNGSEIRGEMELLEHIKSLLPGGPDSEVWAGDDAAVIDIHGHALLVSVDISVEGVHFDFDLSTHSDIGWKALATAVSDIAAMGGKPLRCLVGLSCGHGIDIERLYDGFIQAAGRYDCSIVGGDMSGGGDLVISVTVIGLMPDGVRPVLRSGAHPGDLLYVTGSLGGSAYGLRLLKHDGVQLDVDAIPVDEDSDDARNESGCDARNESGCDNRNMIYSAAIAKYRRPEAHIAEGKAAGIAGVDAMLDVSDGLALDIHRMMAASGVGAEIEHVPVFTGATLDDALGGGEDYELLIATGEPDRLMEAFSSMGLSMPVHIGVCTDTPGEIRLAGKPLPPYGFTHLL